MSTCMTYLQKSHGALRANAQFHHIVHQLLGNTEQPKCIWMKTRKVQSLLPPCPSVLYILLYNCWSLEKSKVTINNLKIKINVCSIENHRPYSTFYSLLVPLIYIEVALTQTPEVKARDWRGPILPRYLITFCQFCRFSAKHSGNGKWAKVLWASDESLWNRTTFQHWSSWGNRVSIYFHWSVLPQLSVYFSIVNFSIIPKGFIVYLRCMHVTSINFRESMYWDRKKIITEKL